MPLPPWDDEPPGIQGDGHTGDGERLQKVLSRAGLGSRRVCDDLAPRGVNALRVQDRRTLVWGARTAAPQDPGLGPAVTGVDQPQGGRRPRRRGQGLAPSIAPAG